MELSNKLYMKTINLKRQISIVAMFVLVISACGKKEIKPDAYGNFEVIETIISSRADGNLERFLVEEGQVLIAGQEVGLIDTTQLHLKKEQLIYSKQGLQDKIPSIKPELDVLKEQIAIQQREAERTKNLLKVGAATAKQLDDINAQIAILKSQLEAKKSQLNTQTSATLSEGEPLQAQIALVKDQLAKSHIINPEKGVVLVKYAEVGETVRYGTPLYKTGDLNEIILRAYVSGDQLSELKLNSEVKVRIDIANDAYKYFNGKLEWISSQAEFTPKIIQTKEDRVNMVYAIKIRVKNPGDIKIGMPGEVFLNAESIKEIKN
jgi:HlyD family secretion protein